MLDGGDCGVIFVAASVEPSLVGQSIGVCHTDDAVITPGFMLKAKYVMHAVGLI